MCGKIINFTPKIILAMKKISVFILVAMMAAMNIFAQKSDKKYIVAGVAFYNVENLFDTINNNGRYDLEFSPEGLKMWNGEKYWKKMRNLARAITAMATDQTPMGPAIIGISEVENESVVADLVRSVDEQLIKEGKEPWHLKYVHHDSPDLRGIDVALLYNPLFFSVENVVPHRLHIPDEPEFLTRDQLCVSGSLLDEPAAFIVNHWPSRLGGEKESSPMREAAGRLSKAIADSLWRANPAMSIVMMGDLNDDPFNKSCAKAFGARKNVEETEHHGFYNPFWRILDAGVGTLCYKGEWNLFDQIMVSGNLVDGSDPNFLYWKATVHNHPFLRTRTGVYKNYPHRTFSNNKFLNGYSDHFPTEIFLLKAVD